MSLDSKSTKKISRFSASSKLTRAAWRTLKLNKQLLVASLLSMAAGTVILGVLLVVLFYVMPTYLGFDLASDNITTNLAFYAALAVYLFIGYATANYFSGAVAHGALEQFRGSNPTLGGSLRAASQKFGVLLVYSGLQATVGLVLNILSDRLPLAGKISTWIAGAVWSIATMFAIPLIMDGKETRPLKVVRSSAGTFKKVWGESIFIGIGLGIIELAVSLLMVFILFGSIGLSVVYSTWVFGIIGAVLFVLALIIGSIILMTLRTIVMSAAYYYASTNQLPAGFDEELLRSTFRPKSAWLR